MKRKRGKDYNGPDSWGYRFQVRRDELGLSQGQISQITGLTQQAISRFENDEVDSRMSTLEKLAQSVAMDVDSLFPTALRPRGRTKAAKSAQAQKKSKRSGRKAD